MNDLDLLNTYDYFLPKELIATKPTLPKEEAKLLVYDRKNDKIYHLKFGNLPEILPPCKIIFNDTKVIKARIYGHKESGGKIELLINRPLDDNKFSVFIKGSVKIDTKLIFENELFARVLELLDDGSRIVKFYKKSEILNTDNVFEILEKIGHTPLPPYIKRDDNKNDEIWYQSVFAKNLGAVAAPTASLHFSDDMIKTLKKTHEIFYLTLHIGAGTFKGVESENIHDHKMHSEWFNIPKNTALVLDSKDQILGVGTTVTRAVEDYARNHNLSKECNLFLNYANKPIRQNYLLTNFHLPKSTLIMLVTAFIGYEKTMEIYKIAIEKGYKFYSYGDAMLVI
ncbi:tRNA preQ1(34) S-adenosylmethionine ribosyltransferase-isomerase QueA [Campylobacter portucalensis]|nr:tRNA preQ1(34) S-adenosylmethionine ribosyltransferase-isomerase QueA [Campylobacter portucalensis]